MDSSMRGRCLKTVEIFQIQIEKPILGQPNFDTQRVLKALTSYLPQEVFQNLKFSLKTLQKLPYTLREKNGKAWIVCILRENYYEITDVFSTSPPDVKGIAIDLGSTTIAFYVYDFLKEKVVQEFSIPNPQIEIGEDILTRLHFARRGEKLKHIQEITRRAINQELVKFKGVYYISICGNTTMTHFLLGLPVNYLFVEPYVPCANWIGILDAEELGLKAEKGAGVFVFPNAGTYFGGDLIAGLFYSEIYKKEELNFFIDVGTNAEVVLGNKDFLLACAGAAGPALEGGIFECGSRAKEGAIEKVIINPEKKEVKFFTIGNKAPTGICGSGIIELVSEMFLKGLLTPEGKFNPQAFPKRFWKIDDEIVFVVALPEETAHKKPIYIKAGEIKSFIRSKGAMFSILSLVCEKVGITFKDVAHFYIAGSFGNHINVESAVVLGMLPEEALQKVIPLGNSAGKGALKFLSHPHIKEIKNIMENITYIELNIEPRFMELLTGALFIPHVNTEMFPLVMKKLKESKITKS